MSIEIFTDIRLKNKTFYGIGGVVDEFVIIDKVSDISEIWAETIDKNIPKIVLGKGSNMVFADKGFRGRVFYPDMDEVEILSRIPSPSLSLKERNNDTVSDLVISVEVGKNFQDFITYTNKLGFQDLCKLSGIPGNTGGFVRGNAGAMGIETADFVIGVEYIDEFGILQKISGKNAEFVYRGSIFKENPDLFITKAIFKLTEKQDPAISEKKSQNMLKSRWEKYPSGRSGGCVFKNPEGNFAGKLLEDSGAKGDLVGGIEIAQEHANFFVNKDNGTQKDILELIAKWQEIVQKNSGILLEPEIYLVDEFGCKVL